MMVRKKNILRIVIIYFDNSIFVFIMQSNIYHIKTINIDKCENDIVYNIEFSLKLTLKLIATGDN